MESIENKEAYLSFRLENEVFAVKVQKVLEVLEIQKITPVPRTAEYVRGVINFRGEILPVIDTRMKFNMPEVEDTDKTVIIVFELKLNDKRLILGAVADGVKDVLSIRTLDIKDVPEMGSNYNTEYVIGMIKSEEEFIMILDIDRVFSAEELITVKEIS